MRLFGKTKKEDKELPSQPQKISLEQLIDELASQPPKAMEKIMALAKARREYNQKLESLQKSLGETVEEEPTSNDDFESTLESLKDFDNANFVSVEQYIETEIPEPPKEKKTTKKGGTKEDGDEG